MSCVLDRFLQQELKAKRKSRWLKTSDWSFKRKEKRLMKELRTKRKGKRWLKTSEL